MMTTVTIDLDDYRTPGVRVFAGRDRGNAVRLEVKLEELDMDPDVEVEVHVPEDISSVNTSFFLGLFGDSIRQIGPGRFREKYRFTGKRLGSVYEAGIREASSTDSPFSP